MNSFVVRRWAPLLLTTLLSHSALANEPVTGFADLHIHMMAEYGYGGAWFHGSHAGHEHKAMKNCSGNAGGIFGLPRDHARTKIPVVNEFLGKIKGTEGDTGLHLGKRKGFPSYEGWPRWDTIAHQQVWEGFLKKAHDSGLSLMVISTVNFHPLCSVMPHENRKYDCKDMNAVDRQIHAIHEFTRTHNWAEVALSPTHAREIIRAGKLALIISIEVSDLFSEGDWQKQLDHYYARGVRTLQPVHQLDNRFSGAAPHHFIFEFFQVLRDIGSLDFDIKRLGFTRGKDGKNVKGLTQDGRDLIQAMMKKNMLVDMAHMSEKSVVETYQLATQRPEGVYPLYISHGHFRDMMDEGKMDDHEKTTPDWIIELIKNTHGMFGLRTGPEKVKSFGSVPNDCHGSTKSFAQVYQYGDQKLGIPIAFGSDLNGFIQQLRPRFGGNRETCGAASTDKERKRQQKAQSQALGTSFDESGFGHIGQIAEVIRELKNFGVDTSHLENSSEAFIKMWERAYPNDATVINRGLASE